MIFTPTEKLLQKGTEISCGLGYDLIVDYGGDLSASKRVIMKLCSPFARVVTTSRDLQLDPPESELLSRLCIQLIMASGDTMLECGLFDGTI